MTTYLTQKGLAARYGMPSKAFGDVLRKLGLKDGAEASQKAIDEGCVGELQEGAYGSYYKWNVKAVGKLLKEQEGMEYASDEEKEALLQDKKISIFWRAVATDVRQGFPDDVFLSMLNICHFSIEDVMRGLPKTSHLRNKRLSYEMVRSLHNAYVLYTTDAFAESNGSFAYTDNEKHRLSDMCVEIFGLTLDEVIEKANYNAEHNPVW